VSVLKADWLTNRLETWLLIGIFLQLCSVLFPLRKILRGATIIILEVKF